MFDNHKLISHQVFIYGARLCSIDSLYIYIYTCCIYIYIVKTTPAPAAAAATTPVLSLSNGSETSRNVEPWSRGHLKKSFARCWRTTLRFKSNKQPPRFQQEAERGWRRWRTNLPKGVWIKQGAPRSAVLRPGLCPVDLAKT